MSKSKKRDYQTLSLFIILGVLTFALVLAFRMVLFAPQFNSNLEVIEAVKK